MFCKRLLKKNICSILHRYILYRIVESCNHYDLNGGIIFFDIADKIDAIAIRKLIVQDDQGRLLLFQILIGRQNAVNIVKLVLVFIKYHVQHQANFSVIVYGRNDVHGYNHHRRAALSLNCIAEVLTNPDDEMVFVDYNTVDELPTFIEAIGLAKHLSPTRSNGLAALLAFIREHARASLAG